MEQRLRIISTGAYLPPEVRPNSWWKKEWIDKWLETRASKITTGSPERKQSAEVVTDNMRRTMEMMGRFKDDPFRGAKTRRVAPEAMASSDMEAEAAEVALKAAGIPREAVGILVTQSSTPDFLSVANACAVHKKLGLAPTCFSMSTTDAMCNAFLMQLKLAEAMLKTSSARYALLIQSCAFSRTTDPREAHSAWLGDCATALVVGLDGGPSGLLAMSHGTTSELFPSVVVGIPGGHWYDDGRPVAYIENVENGKKMLLGAADEMSGAIGKALKTANVAPDEVGFYGSHQGTVWFREVTQEAAGLKNAAFVDTFPWATSVSGSNIPLALSIGAQEGLLRPGVNVAMASGAAGGMWSGAVYRW